MVATSAESESLENMIRERSSRSLQFTLIASTLSLTFFAAEQTALALQGGEDPATLPVLIDKRFGSDGRIDLSLQFTTAFATKYVEGLGVWLGAGYNFSDLLGLEVFGGYIFGSEASIMREIRNGFASTEPPLSDLYQLTWMAGADLVLTPLYGKMSFASELDPSYDLFLLAGGGFTGLRKQEGFEPGTYTSTAKPMINFGLGLRFYFSKLIGLRFEFRDYVVFPDPSLVPVAENDPTLVEDGGVSFNLHFQVGLQFSFGGE